MTRHAVENIVVVFSEKFKILCFTSVTMRISYKFCERLFVIKNVDILQAENYREFAHRKMIYNNVRAMQFDYFLSLTSTI